MTVEKSPNVVVTSYKKDNLDIVPSSGDGKEQAWKESKSQTYETEMIRPDPETSWGRNMIRSICNMVRNTKVVVHILVCIFAIASWVDMNGMWAELPLLVEKAKEGWTLPSYIIIISQAANIGPLLFVLVSCLAPHTKPKLEKITSFAIILLSMVSSFLLAFLWEYTTYVGDTEHSTSLLILNFFLAFGDCTSSVSFYAFMSHMKPEYMPALFIGEGLSGLIPAVIAIGQGAGNIECNGTQVIITEAHFSVRVYFIILSAIIFVSAAAFLILNFSSYCRTEMVDLVPDNTEKTICQVKNSTTTYGSLTNPSGSMDDSVSAHSQDIGYNGPFSLENNEESAVSHGFHQDDAARIDIRTCSEVSLKQPNYSSQSTSVCQSVWNLLKLPDVPMWKFYLLLGIVVLINMTLTTFLSSIQIYSTLPYGLDYYHLVTTLPQIANPVACCFALFIMTEGTVVIVTITLLGHVCVGYIIYVAAMSPNPPLHGQSGGGELAVFIWVAVVLLLIYAKVCIAGVLRKYGRNALICGGACTQIGSLIGAIVGFVLINEYKLFTDAPYCT